MTNDDSIETTGPGSGDAVADRLAPKRGGCLLGCAILLPVAYVLSFPFFALTMRFCFWRWAYSMRWPLEEAPFIVSSCG